MQTKNYSDYLTRLSDMIGLPRSGMTTAELSFLNTYFANNIRTAWLSNNFLDVCPFGEARFAGNTLSAPNNLSNTSYWTTTAATATGTAIANPADGRVTASSLLETAASSAHYANQVATFVPGAVYEAKAWARPIGGRYLYLAVNDGANTYTTFFDLTSGAVGTSSSNLLNAATITQQANGFWLCQFSFTASTSAGTGYHRVQTSSDGATLSYAGDTAKGLYVWGNLLLQTTLTAPSAFLIPNEQIGEDEIDAVFQVWRTNPLNAAYPLEQGYQLSPNGIQLIATSGGNTTYWVNTGTTPLTNPVYLYYRKAVPEYSGSDYSASATYAVGDVVLYTNAASVSNFYKCLVATSAGQNPTTTAASWSLQEIPEVFFHYTLCKGYADWLRMDGQFDKAGAQEKYAQDALDAESDKQERQMGYVLPFRVSTHVTSQSRN